jgi:hypothetical protein
MLSFFPRYAKTQNTYRCGRVNLVCGIIALLAVCAALLCVGCPVEPSAGDLNGTWKNISSYEGVDYVTIIKIDTTAKTIIYEGNYEGNIENTPNYDAVNGVLIIKYTKYANWGETPSNTHNNVGKFGALYWHKLTASTVYMADAYTGYDPVIFGTLAEARNNFTMDKVGDYVNWSIIGAYTKQ